MLDTSKISTWTLDGEKVVLLDSDEIEIGRVSLSEIIRDYFDL